jgi:hypothetical protein
MKEKAEKRNLSDKQTGNEDEDNLHGYPSYPEGEDIYIKYQERKDVNPEGLSNVRGLNENDKSLASKEINSESNATGSDLDIPGSELDDAQENVGSEDEENNYYSIGGDDHDNLDEDKDEL